MAYQYAPGNRGRDFGNPSSDEEHNYPRAETGSGLPVSANTLPKPISAGTIHGPAGSLLKGPVTADGKQKDPLILVGIKLDLEADIHVNVRVRGDVMVGLY
ncbi:hypothetical protein PFICI_14749 [Pestalotiopsis fici W106-1]|uniref:Uncharacterized protein n=1 Tax=Pestalotiopsis fici (strain W106-1 / CGMCC3.15140) TaxID=1229662 RepID=W3WIV6_PESFW|nr:uncharacterized protein PFICI_14749 [Pestalotiopsis fici W106-1]ETS73803.1 hypothetical protein PFICI_14749 [Pestalotiopsis fici W106-1]